MATYDATVTHTLAITEGTPSQVPGHHSSLKPQSTAAGVIPRVTSSVVVGQTIGPFVRIVTSTLVVGQTISKSIHQIVVTSIVTIGQSVTTDGSTLYAPERSTHSLGVQQAVSVIKSLGRTPAHSIGINSHAVGYMTNVQHLNSPWKG